jgi:hypothetical protein
MPENDQSSNRPVVLTVDEWIEIYYALDTKVYDIRDGKYDEEDDPEFPNQWAGQLERIMRTIGPDGTEAAARGVEPCDVPKRPTAESRDLLTISRTQ